MKRKMSKLKFRLESIWRENDSRLDQLICRSLPLLFMQIVFGSFIAFSLLISIEKSLTIRSWSLLLKCSEDCARAWTSISVDLPHQSVTMHFSFVFFSGLDQHSSAPGFGQSIEFHRLNLFRSNKTAINDHFIIWMTKPQNILLIFQ